MPVAPFSIQMARDFEDLVSKTQNLFDDLYEGRLAGCKVGDVFSVGEDDIFSVDLLSTGGLKKTSGYLGLKLRTLPGMSITADGLAVICKSGGGVGIDAEGLYISPSGGSAFGVIQTPAGTYPNADSVGDTLILSASGSYLTITGDATTDTVTFAVTGLTIGTNVQAWSAHLDDIAALAHTDGNIIVGNGSAWVAESGDTARISLGVGTTDSPTFTALTLSGLTASRLLSTNGSKLLASADLNSWVTGTTNRITVTDDTDGTITLTTPQDTHTGASPTFAGLTLSGLTAGSIPFAGTGGLISQHNDSFYWDNALETLKIGGYVASNNYVSGVLGSGWRLGQDQAEFQNAIIRGKLATTVFEKDTINIINGLFLVSKGDILDADMAADGTTMTVSGDCTFAEHEIIRIKDGIDDEWLEVTDVSSAPTYTVTRDLTASYPPDLNPAWKKGTAVGSMSVNNQGFLMLDGSSTYSPMMSVFRRYGAAWNEYAEILRLGNLEGFLSIPTNSYGIAIGDGSAYLKYYASLGLQIKGAIDASTITGGTITGTTIVGGEIYTALTGQRLKIDSTGLTMYLFGDAVKWDGTEKWDGTGHWGPNIRAYIYNTSKNVPFYANSSSNYGDFHYYNKVADPTGAAEIGDTCVVDGDLKVCTVAGTPGTWQIVGDQTAP